MSYTKLSVSALALAAMSATTAAARDQISIVGSSTVFPYTQAVAEQFSNNTGARRRSWNPPAPAAGCRFSAKASAKAIPT